MDKIKVNRTMFVSPDRIEKIVIKGDQAWVYRKSGYPKIFKTTEGLCLFKKRLVNAGCTIHDFKVEYKIKKDGIK